MSVSNEKQERRGEYLVFISHSSKDTWVAKHLAREVKAGGAVPFLDEADIEVGTEFEKEIRQFLNRADELLVLLTPWALDRPYVWVEVGAAWVNGIPIAGLLHGLTATQLQAMPGIPAFLKARDLIELNDADKYFQQLARRTKQAR